MYPLKADRSEQYIVTQKTKMKALVNQFSNISWSSVFTKDINTQIILPMTTRSVICHMTIHKEGIHKLLKDIIKISNVPGLDMLPK